MAGIWPFRLNFVKNLCLNYYSRNLVLFNLVMITPEFSNEFPWISIWRLVKPHGIYCVDILKHTGCVCWIVPTVTFDSIKRTCVCSCLKCTWSVASLTGGRGANRHHPHAKRNVKTGPLPSLYFGICYSFDFSRLFFLRFSDCFPVISGFRIAVQYRICYCFSTIFWVLASGLPSAKFLPGSNLTASDQSLRLYCR